MTQSKIKKIAKNVIKIETEAVSKIEDRIDDIFESAVNEIIDCGGRLIVMGMGKSGLISQKIAATMASTGTPSHFVSPAEAIHGDLGMVKKEDVLLIVSNSGETMELIQVIPSVKRKGISIIGANRSGAFLHLMPIFSSLMAVFLLGEQFSFHHIVGTLLIISGILLSSKKQTI